MSAGGLAAATLVLAGGVLAAPPSAGVPLLSEAETLVDGALLFPDSHDADLFYYLADGLRLGESNGVPQFVFYKSVRVAAGGVVAGGGVVALTLERPHPGEEKLARWQRQKGDTAELRPLPVNAVVCRLLLTAAGPDGEPTALAERRAPWTSRSLSLALSPVAATLLWAALERAGNLSLIADVELVSSGYVKQEQSDGSRELQRTERVDRFSIPLPVSRQEYPHLFSLVHLAEEKSFEYRQLTVFCFDFAEGGDPELWRTVVDIRVETPRDETERHELHFSREADPMQSLQFRLPVPPEQPYRYQVTRILASGTRDIDPWKESRHAHLDVSRYEIETEAIAPVR